MLEGDEEALPSSSSSSSTRKALRPLSAPSVGEPEPRMPLLLLPNSASSRSAAAAAERRSSWETSCFTCGVVRGGKGRRYGSHP